MKKLPLVHDILVKVKTKWKEHKRNEEGKNETREEDGCKQKKSIKWQQRAIVSKL